MADTTINGNTYKDLGNSDSAFPTSTSNIQDNALVPAVKPTVSPAVVTSKSATTDINNIKTSTADTNTAIQNQATKVAQAKAQADADAKAKADADAATKTAADKAAADKAAAAAKAAALSGSTTPTAPVIPTDPTFTNAINRGTSEVKSVDNNLDGTRTVTYKDGSVQQIAGDPNDPQQALNKVNTDIKTQADKTSQQILDIQNGVIPLSAADQAQIAGLQKQYQDLIDTQLLNNTGASGTANVRGYQTGAAEYDNSFQVKTIGAIVQAGANKISDLQIKEASAIATLTQALKDNDINAIKSAYNIANDARVNSQTALKDTITKTQEAIKQAKDDQIAAAKVVYDEVTKPIQDIALDAKKNGADSATIAAINAATDVNSATDAAGMYLQTASGVLGDYLQYKKDTTAKGLVPTDYQTYKDQQDAKDLKNKAKEAYATQAAKDLADANSTGSDKTQQKLEQQYRQVLSKEFSSRTGSLGIENAKVNQANHLNSLLTQYYDPKTGNYNVPTAQYAELVLGLANLISPSGSTDAADRSALMSKTASGDIKGAIQYITGVPQNGNTQAIIKNLVDSVDRQAETAVQNREAALQNMRDQAPTDLSQDRIDKLNKSTEMIGYTGQDRVSKTNVDAYIKANPGEAENVAKLYEVPGATDKDIEDYLKASGKI